MKDKLRLVKDNYDYIIIDSPPAVDDNALATMLACDEVLFVLTPDYTSLGTTLKSIQIAKQRGVPISGLILNRIYDKNFELPIEEIEKISGVPVMAVIPHDVNILKAQAEFVPSTIYKPNSGGSLEFKKLAATLMGERFKPFNFFSLFGSPVPKRQEVNRQIYYTRVFK
mgnify:FL=1